MAIRDEHGSAQPPSQDERSRPSSNDEEDGEEALVPLGAVLEEIQKQTARTASETAHDVLKRARTPPHALDAERATLGALLLEPSAYERVIDEGLRPDDFYRPAHGTIFRAIQDLHAAAEPIDTLTVVEELLRRGQLEAVGGAVAISQLEAMLPTTAHVGAYARLVREKSMLRRLIEAATHIVQSAYRQDKRVIDIIDEAEREILRISEGHARRGIVPMRELVERATKQLEKAFNNKSAITGLATGFRDLDNITSGLQPGELIIIAARPSMGKCLSADSEVLLHDGSVRTIEEIHRATAARLVTLDERYRFRAADTGGTLDDGKKPTFRVTTRLGRTIETTLSHPFLTLDGWKRLEQLHVGDAIAVPRALRFFGTASMRECEIKLLAYTIGELTNARPAILDELAACVHEFGGADVVDAITAGQAKTLRMNGTRLNTPTREWIAPSPRALASVATPRPRARGVESALSAVIGVASVPVVADPVREWLDRLGLWGKRASDKFIPPEIFRQVKPLLALFLNRLFATDGWACVRKPGQPQIGYLSKSEHLARQVQHLLLRFGVVARIKKLRAAFQLDVTESESLRRFVDEIGIFDQEHAVARVKSALSTRRERGDVFPPAILPYVDRARKGERWSSLERRVGVKLRLKERGITRGALKKVAAATGDVTLMSLATGDVLWDPIVEITPTGMKHVYDLNVPGTHNFVANDVVVHNTAFTLNLASHVATRLSKPVMFFSLEMGAEQLVQRLIGSEARIDISNIRRGFIQRHEWSKLAEAAGRLSEAPFYIDETPSITIAEMRNKCRRQMHETGLSLIIVDYLQLMTGPEGYDNKATEVGEISKGLKTIARELNVPVIALSQLNRGVESRNDKRPVMSDLRECVVGDTLVCLADGRRVPIHSLVGTEPEVLAVDDGRVIRARSDKVWRVGQRPVLDVALASGRRLRATAEHRVLTGQGWRRISEMSAGDRVALARAHEHLCWDHIVAISAAGVDDVYDLTVPGPSSWLADGIVSHNSGAIEQDADVIAFLYREDYYLKDKTPENKLGIAEVIVAKHRNGPTGTIELRFFPNITRFDNLDRIHDEGYAL